MDIQTILKERDLSGLSLSGYSLGGMDLRGKIFRGADLSYAHLGSADLRGADLRNANLYQANLGAANLVGADLRYADLRGCNLHGAEMLGADLRESQGAGETTPSPAAAVVKTATPLLEETEDYLKAQAEGFYPISFWGKNFSTADEQTLSKSNTLWTRLKNAFGDEIFRDRTTYGEVRLVRQYKHYSQWAYMITRQGFERIAKHMGMDIKPKSH